MITERDLTPDFVYHLANLGCKRGRCRLAKVFRSLRKVFPNYFVRALGVVEFIRNLEKLAKTIESLDTSMLTAKHGHVR